MRDQKSLPRPIRWFGRKVYHQKDVDTLVSSLRADNRDTETQLKAVNEEWEALTEQLRAADEERETLTAQLEDAKASEEEAWETLRREQELIAEERESFQRDREELQRLKESTERCETLEKEKQQIEQEKQEQEGSLSVLSARFQRENISLRKQMEDVKFELEESQKRSQHLLECLEAEREAVREYQSVASKNAVGEANDRAKQIVSDAITQSDRILSEVVDQRTRLISASRSMYYNAMQFKMSLAKQFSTMEKDMDEAIDLLRILEATPVGGTIINVEEPNRILDKEADSDK